MQKPGAHEYPDDVRPTETDVLFGRDKVMFNHIGNIRFRLVIQSRAKEYENAPSRREKSAIVYSVVQKVHSYGGRFLRKEEGSWRIVTVTEAIQKVGHALRDKKQHELRIRKQGGKITGKIGSPTQKSCDMLVKLGEICTNEMKTMEEDDDATTGAKKRTTTDDSNPESEEESCAKTILEMHFAAGQKEVPNNKKKPASKRVAVRQPDEARSEPAFAAAQAAAAASVRQHMQQLAFKNEESQDAVAAAAAAAAAARDFESANLLHAANNRTAALFAYQQLQQQQQQDDHREAAMRSKVVLPPRDGLRPEDLLRAKEILRAENALLAENARLRGNDLLLSYPALSLQDYALPTLAGWKLALMPVNGRGAPIELDNNNSNNMQQRFSSV